MPELVPKPPELLQAQVATYVAERVGDNQDKAHLFNNIGNLAVGGIEDITRTTDSVDYHTDESGEIVSVPEGTERTAATGEDYMDFLRSVGGSQYESIQGRADMLRAYEQFAPAIDGLRAELADPETRREHPAFLGKGSGAAAFVINREGKDYAVRVPHGEGINPGTIDSHLAGAVLGKGIPHLEQIVAASYTDGVTVAEKMPGKEIGHLTLEDIKHITDAQLGELVDTIVTAHKRGIEIDPKPSNIFYDTEAGFGIIDYGSSKVAGKNSADQELGPTVGSMTLDNAGFYGAESNPEPSIEDYAHDAEIREANLDVLKRYRAAVEQKLTGGDQEKALQYIDSRIQASQEGIDNYSSPEWVSEQIALNKEQRRQRAELAESGSNGWATIDTTARRA